MQCLAQFFSLVPGSNAHLNLQFRFRHGIKNGTATGAEHFVELLATLYDAAGDEVWTVPWLTSNNYTACPRFGMNKETLRDVRAALLPDHVQIPQGDFLDLLYAMVGIGACPEDLAVTKAESWSLNELNKALL